MRQYDAPLEVGGVYDCGDVSRRTRAVPAQTADGFGQAWAELDTAEERLAAAPDTA